MVIERQRLLVLHAANTAQLDRANGKHTARAQRVRIAGTRSSLDRNAEADNYQKAKSGVDFVHGGGTSAEIVEQIRRSRVCSWSLADISFTSSNVGFGGEVDIACNITFEVDESPGSHSDINPLAGGHNYR